jgi:hypothetical protein
MLRKLLWKLIKIPLSPLFTALWVFRKIKGAISTAIWGSKKAAGTAASASKTATAAASNATAREGDATGGEAATRERTRSARESTQASGHDAETERQYGRFERLLAAYAVYSFLLPFAFVLLWAPSVPYLSVGDVFGAVLGEAFRTAIVPVLLAGIVRIRSKATWGIAFGVTALLFALQVLGLVGMAWLDSVAPATVGLDRLFDDPLVFALTVVGIGILAGSLRAGWNGRGLVLDSGGVAPAPESAADPAGTAPDSPSATTREAQSADRNDGSSARSDPSPDAASTADRRSGEGTPSPSGTTERPTSTTAGTDSAAEPGDDTGGSSGSVPSATAARGPSAPSDETSASSDDEDAEPDRAESSDADIENALEGVRQPEVAPDEVRELQETLPDDDLPENAARSLETLADRDDPEVRLAVCEVCATIDDERADAILKGCRIDTDDRVSDTAIEALR